MASQQTLWDVMDHLPNKGDGLNQSPWLDEDTSSALRALQEGDIDDVVAFLASLTTPEYAELGRAELARQAGIAKTNRPQRDVQRAFGPKPHQPPPPQLP